jgi:hypothetical protein
MTLGSTDGWGRPGPTVEQRRTDIFPQGGFGLRARFPLTPEPVPVGTAAEEAA